MDNYRVEQCGSCHQPIIWAVTTTGRNMPVDAEPPLQGGTIALEPGPAGKPRARVLTNKQLTTTAFGRRDLRTSHFARCPDAEKWRHRARTQAGAR